MSNDQPRVLFLTTSFPLHRDHWSGVFLLRQAIALTRLNCPVTVLAPGDGKAAAREEIDGVAVHRFPYPGDRTHPLAYGGGIPANLKNDRSLWWTVPGFATALRRHAIRLLPDIDILHAHWSFAGLLATLPGIASRRPLVVSFHGSDLAQPAGPLAWAAKRAARRAAGVVVHSDEMKRRALALGLPEAKILVIPHGIAIDDYPLVTRAAEPVRILAVGRLSEEKGFDVLLEALRHFSATLDWRLIVIGEGPLREKLLQQARSIGIAGRVEFAGPLPPQAVREQMGHAHLLAVPSRREGFSVVTLEAMAAGLPVVGTAVGALPQLVRQDETGFLVPPGDVAALAAALRHVLTDPARRDRMGERAREMAARDYSPTAVNRPLAELYRRLGPANA
ncbi:MAG: glycosyltransferase family 4 protein [Myxococcales bacterium]|nr:glycosyltransferase family 4 protein [Myxococcales bacterium]